MKKWFFVPIILLSAFCILGELSTGEASAVFRLLEIRHWSAPDHTRVVIDLTGPPVYDIPQPENPLIMTLKFSRIILPKGKGEISVNDRVIQKIRVNPWGKEGAEVALFLVKPAQWKVFSLKPYQDKPERLVIDIFRPDLEEKEKVEKQISQALKAKRKKIIVLDPGHGGEDPGAIGPRGTREKDIVLNLARKLQKSLDESGEVRAFLTRRGDYFVPLNKRIKIAQEYGADLFVSLHTNGSPKRQTRGTSVYCLSLKGATDKATQLLAQKENASDMIGGISLAAEQKDLDSILLDLEMTHTINESLQLGGLMLKELSRINQIQFSQPLQAGFAVLKAPSFPSVLVETAYITHPLEEKLLKKESFQMDLTKAIFSAVKKFIPLIVVKEEGTRTGVFKEKG
ncbi:MAG: N-acetylmuramoyl-L-alanine amidase [Deltaproteobacteria bacterium]|nr:N-acetylmuramoyl-L-alanine amidase [Deltaproteobacteria bacterium]